MTAPERSPSRGVVTRYAIGSIGTGGFATLPGLVLVFYLTDTLGVTALVAGLVVTAAKVWDVLIDPWIGERSDRALAATGTRRTWMRVGALALPVAFVVTFAVPAGLAPAASGTWVFLAFLATATAFSLFQVPYIALPAELTDDYDARTRLLTWRVVVLSASILLFGAGGPLLRRAGGDDEALGYLVMAIVAGLVIGAGMLVATFTAPRGSPRASACTAQHPRRLRRGHRALRRSRPFRDLLVRLRAAGPRHGRHAGRRQLRGRLGARVRGRARRSSSSPSSRRRCSARRCGAGSPPHRQGARIRAREHPLRGRRRRASSGCSGRRAPGSTARWPSRAPPTRACSRCRWRCSPT